MKQILVEVLVTFPYRGEYHGAGKRMKLPVPFARVLNRIKKVRILTKEDIAAEKPEKTVATPPRRRGRPTKAEMEARQAAQSQTQTYQTRHMTAEPIAGDDGE